MTDDVRSLPFALKTVFQDLFLLSFAVDPDRLNALLPAPIHPLMVDGRAFVSIVVGNMRGMRPALTPEVLGFRYYQIVYRALVCLKGKDGQVRPGVFFLRSDVNNPLVGFFGNQFTEFRFQYYRTGMVNLFQRADDFLLSVETEDKGGDLVFHLKDRGDALQLPPQAGFSSVQEEKKTLVELFHAFAYDEKSGQILDLEIEREEWNLRRLECQDHFSAFFSENPFTRTQAAPDSMLYIRECHYLWKPMVRLAVEDFELT
jgi:uncharacterized protein YqjF (DUF2071 family)